MDFPEKMNFLVGKECFVRNLIALFKTTYMSEYIEIAALFNFKFKKDG